MRGLIRMDETGVWFIKIGIGIGIGIEIEKQGSIAIPIPISTYASSPLQFLERRKH